MKKILCAAILAVVVIIFVWREEHEPLPPSVTRSFNRWRNGGHPHTYTTDTIEQTLFGGRE